MDFPYTGDSQKGILNFMHTSEPGNYFSRVGVFSSSDNHVTQKAQHAIDFDSKTYWHSVDYGKIGNFIVVYVNDYYIKLKGYAITSGLVEPKYGTCHPQHWGFDASNDNRTYHNQVNFSDSDNSMNHKGSSKYVEWKHGTYKYFRLMITGPAYDNMGKNSIDLAQIELFGTLIPALPCMTIHTKKLISSFYSFIILFISFS